MLCVQARRIRNAIARMTFEGRGIRARQMADGRWVKTMVCTNPMRFDREEATRFEAEVMILVTKKRVPSWPSGRENLDVKK